MTLISSYAKQAAAPTVEDDVYLASIVSAEVEKNPDGTNKEDAYGKNRLLVKFELDDLEDDAGGPITLRRSYAISYGAMGGTQAALAIMIGAAMGMPANDKAVRHVTTEQLEGRIVRVQTGTVERDGRTYTNILNVLPPPKAKAPKPKTAEAKLGVEEDSFADLPLEDEIPF